MTYDEQRERAKELQRMANYAATAKRINMSTNYQIVRAKHGPPYQSQGNCEICNASGPVWNVEERVTWNQIPLCAACIISAEKAQALAGREEDDSD